MEYVEGPTIKDYLDKNKVFEEKEALRITLAIAEALKHAAQKGLIHRDIKPENVILTKEGGVKLADLGLARLTDDEKWGLSEAGMAIGTPYYISPEQVRGETNIDIRADIYSLGATLYHMVTGKVPYGGETPNDVMRKHVDLKVHDRPARPLESTALRRPGHGRRDDDGQEPRASLPDARRPDPRPQMPAARRKPDDRRPEARDPAGPGRGRVRLGIRSGGASEEQMVELASYVNNRNHIIATIAMLLAVSVITNVILFVARLKTSITRRQRRCRLSLSCSPARQTATNCQARARTVSASVSA